FLVIFVLRNKTNNMQDFSYFHDSFNLRKLSSYLFIISIFLLEMSISQFNIKILKILKKIFLLISKMF
ncbi:MAG: hypothetical protein U9Q83_00550, partial [Bacteroidota bacterium]|nr:hypothetical protein [Bacteroidota bacterium]